MIGGWSGDAAQPAWLDDGRTAVLAGVDALRYGDNAAAGLPGGDLTAAAPARTETPMLTVTMTDPASCYLRGFVGETYANGRWTTLDSSALRLQGRQSCHRPAMRDGRRRSSRLSP